MRIADIEVWVVNVPLTTTFSSTVDRHDGTTRTVLRIRTTDGREGWGETMHGRPTATLVRKLAPEFIGSDPRAVRMILSRQRMVPFFYGYIGYCALAGLEMAMLDLCCRSWDVPLHLYLGGAFRSRIPITALLTTGAAGATPDSELPQELARIGAREVAEHGFTALKFKGSFDPAFDVRVMAALRAALPTLPLRVDPNAAWSVNASIRAAQQLEEIGLEYLEDPCAGIEGMARVADSTRIPLCTNMCVVEPDHIAPAVRAGAVDIVHADVHKWGGVLPTMDLYAACAAFGLGVNFHSGGELGISTACHLHVAAAFPRLDHAIDSTYYLAAEDVLTDRIAFSGGALTVPEGPGLGVDVDPGRLTEAARRNEIEGDHTP
ncbi:MAG TPA: enolase C-terminal domain-like protein [Mycobacteriales bacterium]|nr:enolase C-terminal domain-like protein [Mycobacteriales bacterium]